MADQDDKKNEETTEEVEETSEVSEVSEASDESTDSAEAPIPDTIATYEDGDEDSEEGEGEEDPVVASADEDLAEDSSLEEDSYEFEDDEAYEDEDEEDDVDSDLDETSDLEENSEDVFDVHPSATPVVAETLSSDSEISDVEEDEDMVAVYDEPAGLYDHDTDGHDIDGHNIDGLAAYFDGPNELMHAATMARDEGFDVWDAYSPFPIHGIEDAMGIGRSWLPWVTFAAGGTGFMLANLLQFGTLTFDWPMIIGGKPYAPWPSFVPVMFELTVLIGGVTTALVMLIASGCFRKPKIIDPEITNDRFVLWISTKDSKFNQAHKFMQDLDPVEIRPVKFD